MKRRLPPGAGYNLATIPTDPKERHEELVELFGQYVMWLRNWTLSSTRSLVDSADLREKMGTILRRPYEEAAKLSEEDRKRAIELADSTVDGFIELLLRVLAHVGGDFSLGPKHSVRYKLVMEILDKDAWEVVLEEIINRNGQRHFGDYWGRWLNRHRDM